MMKKLFYLIMILLLFFPISFAVTYNNFDDCTEIGNHYYCTTDTFLDQGTGIYDAGSYGIYISGIDKTISGAAGTPSSIDGGDVDIEFRSTFRVVILNSNITIQGGTGYTQPIASSNNGGAGGYARLFINSP